MARFINRVLSALDRIYGFDQGLTATDQVQLAPGIQLVHNVAREVEIGAGVGGNSGFLWLPGVNTVHAGVGALTDQVDIWAAIENALSLQLQRQRLWLWLLEVRVVATSSLFTSVNIYVTNALQPSPGPNGRNWLVFRGTTAGTNPTAAFTSTVAGVIPDYEMKRPVLVLNGAFVKIDSTATGAVTFLPEFQFWMGPAGVLPPGAA